MEVLVNVQSISKAFSETPLFSDLQFSIFSGDKIGLIGPNGTGKSTLLKILAGIEEVDSGVVAHSNQARVSYVAQNDEFPPGKTIYEIVREAAVNGGISETEIEREVRVVLGRCNMTNPDEIAENLSGGWKKRVSLARGFVTNPSLILLDEPTNHLDIEGVLWLERFLKETSSSWLVISHDRMFLESGAEKIFELDRIYENGVLTVNGNYSKFLKERSDYLASEQSRHQTLKSKVKREEEWLAKSPRARATKAKGRIDQAYRLMDELTEVKSRMKTTEAGIDFTSSERKTKRLLEAHNISKSMGERELIKKLDFTLSPDMKIGVLGVNGSGKSTLLKLIAGELEPDQGTIKRVRNLEVVYFSQQREELNPNETLKNSLAESGDSVVFQGRSLHVVSWAARFQFSGEQLDTKVSELSGGEKARLFIARLMLRPADILLLDEPTNDLDIETLEVLEKNLIEFPGAILIVSHDRYLLGKVCNGFIGLDGKGSVTSVASFEQWRETLDSSPTSSRSAKEKGTRAKKVLKRLSYIEQREFDQIEKTILKAEERVEEYKLKVSNPTKLGNSEQVAKAYQELSDAENEVHMLYERWEELTEKKKVLESS